MSPRLSVFLPVVRRWWALLLVGGVVAGIAGYAFVSQQKPSYEAKVELLVGPINTNFDTLKASGQLAQSYAQLASSGKVLQATISQLKLPLSTTQLDSHVRTTANAVTRVLSIRVQDDNPQLATKIANSLASNLATLATAGTVSPAAGQLRVIDPADTATRIRAKTGIIVAIAVLFGMFATLIGVLLVEYLSGRVRSEEELAEVAQVACLGVVEGLRRRSPEGALLVETEPESPSAAS
ncbi:MAG TPA: hypothetical protein VFK76_03025, partial [Gaiellaceae bacterium]|nr:hypothetical protein [Gaiellaceae bacterium]